MKLNWGYKIMVFYGIFVIGILYLVFQASRQKMDLVTADYYGEELKYQERINDTKRADALSHPLQFTVLQGVMTLQFPKEFEGKSLSGDVTLYCPSDDGKDIHRNLDVVNNIMKLTIPEANKGQHTLQVKWKTEGGESYYFEKGVNLQ